MGERQKIANNVDRQNIDKNIEDVKEDSTGPPSGQKYPRLNDYEHENMRL